MTAERSAPHPMMSRGMAQWQLDSELSIPSTDVCAWCSDSECDGIGCIANLDPDDDDDHEAINELHGYIRAGRAMRFAVYHLAVADSTWPLPPPPNGTVLATSSAAINPYRHDHNPLNADIHGGICSACEWERAEAADSSTSTPGGEG